MVNKEDRRKDRNTFRCSFCGAEIYTEANSRMCYKCDCPMMFIGKESKFRDIRK